MSTPLSSTNPQSIEELLSRDPLELTEEEVTANTKQLIVMLRTEREVWEREQSKAKLTGKRTSGQTTKKLQKQAALDKIRNSSAAIDISDIKI